MSNLNFLKGNVSSLSQFYVRHIINVLVKFYINVVYKLIDFFFFWYVLRSLFLHLEICVSRNP
jgi:hypothetical protein